MKSPLLLETAPSTLSTIKSKNAQSVGRNKERPEAQRKGAVKPSTIKSMTDEKRRANTSPSINLSTCNCSRTNCLKLYCECFRLGSFCNSLCKCKECANTKDNKSQVQATKRVYLNKNLMAFSKKPKSQTSSCSCRSNRWVELTHWEQILYYPILNFRVCQMSQEILWVLQKQILMLWKVQVCRMP